MGKSTAFDNNLLKLIFQGTGIANLADNASVAPLTNLYVSLHTADPSAGNQSTSEASYTGYARVAVARTSGGWTVSNNTVVPVSAVTFGTCTGGSSTVIFFGIGYSVSGANSLIYSGTVSPTLGVTTGIVPQLTAASTIIET